MRLASLLVLLVASGPLFAAEPFFAPAEPSGSIAVKLYPTEGVPPARRSA